MEILKADCPCLDRQGIRMLNLKSSKQKRYTDDDYSRSGKRFQWVKEMVKMWREEMKWTLLNQNLVANGFQDIIGIIMLLIWLLSATEHHSPNY